MERWEQSDCLGKLLVVPEEEDGLREPVSEVRLVVPEREVEVQPRAGRVNRDKMSD